MVVDINAFESNDKGSTEKYYRKIPKEMLVVAFKKDLFEYRPFQKSSLYQQCSSPFPSLFNNFLWCIYILATRPQINE